VVEVEISREKKKEQNERKGNRRRKTRKIKEKRTMEVKKDGRKVRDLE